MNSAKKVFVVLCFVVFWFGFVGCCDWLVGCRWFIHDEDEEDHVQ